LLKAGNFAAMFTGIIEATGTVAAVEQKGSNRTFWISSSISNELKVDQSVSHDGVCLTVEEIKPGSHRVTAIEETLLKSTLGSWQPGDEMNLERCLLLPSRLDGHLVQGHVDTTGICTSLIEKEGSWEYEFEFDPSPEYMTLIVEKGSISLNGTSLTVFNIKQNRFTVAIIPYTYEHTSINNIKPGKKINLEFDILGKYVLRNQQVRSYS
jgi:riboflavin synthase